MKPHHAFVLGVLANLVGTIIYERYLRSRTT